MRHKLSPVISALLFALLGLAMVSGCGQTTTTTGSSSQANPSPGEPQAKVSPPIDKTEGKNEATADSVPVSTNSTADEAMILSVQKDVSLKRHDAADFVPILRNVAFRIGDLLRVGSDSVATVLCSDRGICALAMGSYSSCCSDSCKTQVQMLRIGTGPSTPTVRRTDLPVAERQTLEAAEVRIHQLELGPVTTQFLITKLYSGWKLEETNQELDRLTNQLKQPEAKQELKDLYLPVIRKTGDMHLKVNQVDKAKELYQLNISSQSNDSVEKAAAHEGLATAYKQAGDSNQAVRNYELARDIYVKQGDKKAATATEQKISNTKIQSVEKVAPKTNVRSRAKQ